MTEKSVNIIARGFNYPAATRREHQLQVRSLLGSFPVRRAHVTLASISEDRGERDIYCTLEVHLDGGESLVFKALRPSARAAVTEAARRGVVALSARGEAQPMRRAAAERVSAA